MSPHGTIVTIDGLLRAFQVVLVVKNQPANTGGVRCPGEGDSTPLQYCCLGNPGDRGAWRATSPWGCTESDKTEGLHFPFSPSCTGEGNGSPLQCSCLENPRDGGAWWAVYGVAQSRTRLKRLSGSSSSSSSKLTFLHSCFPPFILS